MLATVTYPSSPVATSAYTQARTSADTNTFTDTSTALFDGSLRRSAELPVSSTAFEMRKMLSWRPIHLELVASNYHRDRANTTSADDDDDDVDVDAAMSTAMNIAKDQQVQLYCRSTTRRWARAKVFSLRGPNAGAIRIRTKLEKMEISITFTTRLHKLRLRTNSSKEYEQWFYLFIRSASNLVMEIAPHKQMVQAEVEVKVEVKVEVVDADIKNQDVPVSDARVLQVIRDTQACEHVAIVNDDDNDVEANVHIHSDADTDTAQVDARLSMCWSLAGSFEADLHDAHIATLQIQHAEIGTDAEDDEQQVSQSCPTSPSSTPTSSRSLPPSLLFFSDKDDVEGDECAAEDADDVEDDECAAEDADDVEDKHDIDDAEVADDVEDYRGHGDRYVPSSDAWKAYLIVSDEEYQVTRGVQHRESSLWSLDHLAPLSRETSSAFLGATIATIADEDEDEDEDRRGRQSSQGRPPARDPPDESPGPSIQRGDTMLDVSGSIATSPFRRLQLRLRYQDAVSHRRTPAGHQDRQLRLQDATNHQHTPVGYLDQHGRQDRHDSANSV
ncbi:hypothetical protein Poli38472_009811 [Pythium oligandrum]|uniref:Uncharacterized protein n=1 Tax=Pythium oligandrum TaxID=41045 RepID=A0A8K1CGZ0_PYTOL|nr:hypothetical protein Poli38472_009811 [Pythium oligandrum]|eukprot:TMW62318.1 hypothetical protein Poli38472_009811 [Pythium oligandrum]